MSSSWRLSLWSSHSCVAARNRRVTSGHPKIWRSHVAGTSRYRIAVDYFSLGYSYPGSYYGYLGECAAAPVRAPDKTSVGNLHVYLDWWRRRESNPRLKMLLVKRLHAYSRSCPRPSAFPPSPRRSRPPLRTDKKRLPLA